MRSFLFVLAPLLAAVSTAEAAQVITFTTDTAWVECPVETPNCTVEPKPLDLTLTVKDEAAARGHILPRDVLTFALTAPWTIFFPIYGEEGWTFVGSTATFNRDGSPCIGNTCIAGLLIDGRYLDGWSFDILFASHNESFRLSGDVGSLESDGPDCHLTGACRVQGHWDGPVPVPAPSSLWLMAAGLVGLTRLRRRT